MGLLAEVTLMSDNAEQIAQNALKPKKMAGDAGSVEQHSIPDMIEADRYAKAVAGRGGRGGIRRTKIIPPGAA